MTKVVKLSQAYTVGSETFSEVRLHEPKLGDLMALGDPIEMQKGVVVRYNDVITAYLERLVAYPAVGAIREINLRDGLAVRGALVGFFIEALSPPARPTSSSSASIGDPATSQN